RCSSRCTRPGSIRVFGTLWRGCRTCIGSRVSACARPRTLFPVLTWRGASRPAARTWPPSSPGPRGSGPAAAASVGTRPPGVRAPKNPVPGLDVAGSVQAVGANVTAFQPGDEVFGTCRGAYAEYTSARVDRLAPKPANLSFEQAAAVPTSGATALHAVRDKGRIRAGQRVLIIGAGGGVGTLAVQLAKALGAGVTGVCSTTKVELVRSIGADHVIEYTR